MHYDSTFFASEIRILSKRRLGFHPEFLAFGMKSPMELLLCEPCAGSPIKFTRRKWKVGRGSGLFWIDKKIIWGLIIELI